MSTSFEDYISRCEDPDRKAEAEKVMESLNTRRKYKAEILEPGDMKLEAGRTYKAEILEPSADDQDRQTGDSKKIVPMKKPNLTEREELEREWKKNEIRHHLHKFDPGYSDKGYQDRKADLLVKLASLNAAGSIRRSEDGQLIECR
jgi:hypothetical protein